MRVRCARGLLSSVSPLSLVTRLWVKFWDRGVLMIWVVKFWVWGYYLGCSFSYLHWPGYDSAQGWQR